MHKQISEVVRSPIGYGRCPTCRRLSVIVQVDRSAREGRRCIRCRTNARQRALLSVVADLVDLSVADVYEPSPTGRASAELSGKAATFVSSVYTESCELGEVFEGHRNEDLERLTFDNRSFDLVVTQDVLEHTFDPRAAIMEISRVLRPGGHHIFTVPIDLGLERSRTRARRAPDGTIEHVLPAQYHGDPYSRDGALVVTDWGQDAAELISRWSGLPTRVEPRVAPPRSKDPATSVFVSHLPT